MKNFNRAAQTLAVAARSEPGLWLDLARLSLEDPQLKPRSVEAAKLAAEHFGARLEQDPRNVETRLNYVDSLLLSGEINTAETCLLEGLKLEDSQTLKSALSEYYRQLFVATSKYTDRTWSGNIDLLDRAYRLDPNNARISEEIARLARIADESPHDELMGQLLRNLAEGKATSVTHKWVAERYLLHENYEKAIPHLEQAVKRDPGSADCWNNLAYSLSYLYPERREEALTCVDNAIRIAPTAFDYHDTRGTILMALDRPKDAITSFEQAIELIEKQGLALQKAPGYHERLAEAYSASGNSEMAAIHTKLAGEINVRYQAWLAEQDAARAAATAQIAEEKLAKEKIAEEKTTDEKSTAEKLATEKSAANVSGESKPAEGAAVEPTSSQDPKPDKSAESASSERKPEESKPIEPKPEVPKPEDLSLLNLSPKN